MQNHLILEPTSEKREISTKEIDLELLVFVERYATNLLKWDILTFFGIHPDDQKSAAEITSHIGRNYRAVRSELGDLVILGILHKWGHNGDLTYQLTNDYGLRSQVIKLANKRH